MATPQEQDSQDMINVLAEQNSIAKPTNQEVASSTTREGSAATHASSSAKNQAPSRKPSSTPREGRAY